MSEAIASRAREARVLVDAGGGRRRLAARVRNHLKSATFASVQTLTKSQDQLTDELLTFLGHLMKGTQGEVLEVAAGLDLSLSQLRAIHVLDAADRDLALHELARRMGLSVAATSRAVDGLVRGELASRREDAEDRRVKRIAITTRGAEAVGRLVAARRQGLAGFVAGLEDTEREALSGVLELLLARPEIKDHCPGGAR